MSLDVVDLRAFYASALGRVTRRLLSAALTRSWGDTAGQALVGLGYATPYLSLWEEKAERTLAFMPAAQGVVNWPRARASATALVEPLDLPLRDGSVDRVLVVHALEAVDNPAEMLAEVWRVLSPGGRALIVAPNRRSLWARVDNTPFGEGRPFSRGQINRLLRQALLTPERWHEALYMPPFDRRMVLRASSVWEQVGSRLGLPPAGVHIIDATKQLYRPATARPAKRLAFRLQPVLAPALPSPNRSAP